MTNFFILILYPATLLNSFIGSKGFCVENLMPLQRVSCHLQIVTVLPLPFQFGYVLFFCLIAVARISNTMFNRSDKSGHPPYSFFHFLYDRENTSHKNRSFLNLFVRTRASTELLQKLLNCFTYFHLPCWKSAYLVMNSLSKPFMFPIAFSSVQLPSRVRLFVAPWITVHQASLPITIALVWY